MNQKLKIGGVLEMAFVIGEGVEDLFRFVLWGSALVLLLSLNFTY